MRKSPNKILVYDSASMFPSKIYRVNKSPKLDAVALIGAMVPLQIVSGLRAR